MAFRPIDIVALVELVFYVPALIAAFFVCRRHGFSRSSGWYYTFTLCLIRVVGATCQIVSIADSSTGLSKTILALSHIGLTPLLLATLGMLSRLLVSLAAGLHWLKVNMFRQRVDRINSKVDTGLLTVKHFRIAQLFVVLGALFGVIGISQASTSSVSTWSRVAVICYALTYILLVFFSIKSASYVQYVPEGENLLTPAILMALPLVFVRLVYQILLYFVNRGPFSHNDRGIIPNIAMAVVEEMLVVLIFLGLGLKLRKLSEAEQGPILLRPWNGGTKDKRRRGNNRRTEDHYGAY